MVEVGQRILQSDSIGSNDVAQEALRKAIAFYDIEKTLTVDERVTLARVYAKVASYTVGFGWAGFIGGFSSPFALKYFRTGSAKGANLKVGILIGLFNMMFSGNYGARYCRRLELQNYPEDAKIHKIIKHLPPYGAFGWKKYYERTIEDPSSVIKDPRRLYDKNFRKSTFLNNDDMLGLKRNTKSFDEPHKVFSKEALNEKYKHIDQSDIAKLGLSISEDRLSNAGDSEDNSLTSWERIRKSNNSPTQEESSWNKLRNQQQSVRKDSTDSSEILEYEKILQQEEKFIKEQIEKNDDKWS
ncbi:Rci37p ASCRUDRAFT_9634 [Ascoidea rubescens DSM 1968]|uniref:Uncharacterized protein n=1 Tax=Ascoidea rubescens DSM 1968 TaxID=1344418 RepID=A0A1D2VC97_9ASCO|nr:hypothetical protein ASCRUDRAFT_9634 [Ascoidea rubescens DSM 1968]ODV59239.1 hypothetical protein ASCRUDRAFT_9634 [Ascoidea rubescens DSM 1968]